MWPNLQFTADLVTFTEEILNGKLHFFCNVILYILYKGFSVAKCLGIPNIPIFMFYIQGIAIYVNALH